MSDEILFSTIQSTYGSYVLSFGGHSVKGSVRDFNNDTLWCGEGLIIVADGAGKAESAGIASRTAVEVIESRGREKTGVQYTHRLDDVVKMANERVYENAQRAETCMATTCTAFRWYERGEKVAWELAHVGDSTAYQANVRALTCRKMTVNHAEGRRLTRAVGREATVEVDYKEGVVEEGDVFIFCSDGVRRGLGENDIIGTVAEKVKKRNNPEEAARKTNDFAHLFCDGDNATTAVLYVTRR